MCTICKHKVALGMTCKHKVALGMTCKHKVASGEVSYETYERKLGPIC